MMMIRIGLYVFFCVVVSCLGGAAIAETKVEFAKQPANTPNIVNGQTQGQNLSGRDLKAAQEMSGAYANQIFLSECYASHKRLLSVDAKTKKAGMTPEQLTKSCGCMSEKIIKAYSATELIGYMSTVHGARPQGRTMTSKDLGFVNEDPVPYKKGDKIPQKAVNYNGKPEQTTYSKIAVMTSNPTEQKKCGLIP